METRSRASTSVIGTVLLVAVVVVIGSTVAVFSLGFADASRKPLQVTLAADQENLAGDNETTASLRYTLENGDSIDPDQIRVVIDGAKASEIGVPVVFSGQSLSAGDTITIQQNDRTDLIGLETVRLIYESANNEETKLLETMTVATGGPAQQVPEFTFEPFSTGGHPGSPWSTSRGSYNELKVSDSEASEGSNSVHLQAHDGGYARISAEVNLTHVAKIKFAHKHTGGESGDFFMRIDGTTLKKGESGGWQTYSIDVSDYSGTHTIQFHVREDGNQDTTKHYVDNVRFVHETGNLVSEEHLLE